MLLHQQMLSLEKDYVHEHALEDGFQGTWAHITFSLMWVEEHFGVNPKVSVLTEEAITQFFVWMDQELGYSAKTRSSIASALGDFFGICLQARISRA